MKDFLTNTSTTSVIAVILVSSGMGLVFFLAFSNLPHDNTRATQIITGTYSLLMAIVGYYFGASKQRSSAINADTVNTVNTGTDGKESK